MKLRRKLIQSKLRFVYLTNDAKRSCLGVPICFYLERLTKYNGPSITVVKSIIDSLNLKKLINVYLNVYLSNRHRLA